MHSALSIASLLLAASGAFAYPQAVSSNATAETTSPQSGSDTEVRVILSSQATETGSQTVFKSVNSRKHKNPVGSTGPFETIEINVGADAKQDLRCQALDKDGKPLVAVRGANIDITFADGDGGPWTFSEPKEVSRIVCDPALLKGVAADFQVKVTLGNGQSYNVDTLLGPVDIRVEAEPEGDDERFKTVNIDVGAQVDPALRCGLKNGRGKDIIAVRGENRDITFSDADKGKWDFERAQRVSQIICDPAFVANNLNAQ